MNTSLTIFKKPFRTSLAPERPGFFYCEVQLRKDRLPWAIGQGDDYVEQRAQHHAQAKAPSAIGQAGARADLRCLVDYPRRTGAASRETAQRATCGRD